MNKNEPMGIEILSPVLQPDPLKLLWTLLGQQPVDDVPAYSYAELGQEVGSIPHPAFMRALLALKAVGIIRFDGERVGLTPRGKALEPLLRMAVDWRGLWA